MSTPTQAKKFLEKFRILFGIFAVVEFAGNVLTDDTSLAFAGMFLMCHLANLIAEHIDELAERK